MLPVVIAIGIAGDPVRRIAEAQLATAPGVAAARAELRAIKSGKQAAPSALPGNGCESVLSCSRTVGGILRWIGYAAASAAIGISHEHAPELIYRNVVKVEQVAAGIAAPLVPYTASLHRVGRSCVGGGPGAAAIVGEGYVEMP